MGWLRLVTFDATGTLLRLRGSVGEQYAAACRKYGVKADTMKLTESFSTHWTKMSKELPCFGKPHISSHEWWSKLVKNTIIDSGIEEKEVAPVYSQIFNKLWSDYCTSELWDVDKDAKPVLDYLASQSIQIAIVSNFDERLHTVLESVGLKPHFDAPEHELSPLLVTTSREVGAEKPDNVIFSAAIKKAQVLLKNETLTPAKCLHIGDNKKKDAQGAVILGMQAAYLHRDSPISMREPTPAEPFYSINKLSKLIDVVDHVNKTAPR